MASRRCRMTPAVSPALRALVLLLSARALSGSRPEGHKQDFNLSDIEDEHTLPAKSEQAEDDPPEEARIKELMGGQDAGDNKVLPGRDHERFKVAENDADVVLSAVQQVQAQTRVASERAHQVSDHFTQYGTAVVGLAEELDKVSKAQNEYKTAVMRHFADVEKSRVAPFLHDNES
eukprot:CAMPEP_0179280670 /NCGR_PEP_ID=MMETSP0797-20121207/36749_1 /TAXON_ID=47934 /ORGANISM="Dinophysis acuminata, Strain DAEP01" /LENGTH=175 /DNA_ID=CAMNT_0020989337 /DNA_START=10 /DNA_END=537 /DNA_ORIENTATION=+